MTTTTKAPRLVKTLTARFPGYIKNTYVTYTAPGTFAVHTIVRFDSGSSLKSVPETFRSVVAAVHAAAASYANP